MIKAGITGGIGSGKTTCCKLFEEKGVPVYYADIRAKTIYVENPEVKKRVIELLGEEAYKNGKPDRPFIANRVFNDKNLLSKLNAVIHPAVGADYQNWLYQHRDVPYTLKEAAVMIEAGSHQYLDVLIVVTAPKEIRVQRIAGRDGTDQKQIEARMNNQMSDEERLTYADYVIENTTLERLQTQVDEIHKTLTHRAGL